MLNNVKVDSPSKPSHNFGSLPRTPRSAARFLLQLIAAPSLGSSAYGAAASPKTCVVVSDVREKVMTGVWLFSGVVYTWGRVIQ